jgi:hypothetical protein
VRQGKRCEESYVESRLALAVHGATDRVVDVTAKQIRSGVDRQPHGTQTNEIDAGMR